MLRTIKPTMLTKMLVAALKDRSRFRVGSWVSGILKLLLPIGRQIELRIQSIQSRSRRTRAARGLNLNEKRAEQARWKSSVRLAIDRDDDSRWQARPTIDW